MYSNEQVLQTVSQIQSSILSNNISKILRKIRNREVVLFLGNTRAGKSTTVNYIIGNNLQAVHVAKKKYNIKNVEGAKAGPAIGKGATSETSNPTAWKSSKISGLIVDAPGFDDNRGEAQDIINAFNIKEIIRSASSVKFVLITDINDITGDNVAQFCKFIDTLYATLPQVELLLKGMTIVFTKDEDSTTKDEISDYMYEKIISQEDLRFFNKSLVKYFADNKNQIVIVRMPTNEGPLKENEDIFDDLIKTIQCETKKLPKKSLVNITPGISEKSRLFLYEAITKLSEFREFEDMLTDTRNEFSVFLETYNHRVDTIGKANREIDSLTNLNIAIINSMNSSRGIVEILIEMITFADNPIVFFHDMTHVENILNFLKFVDELLQTNTINNFVIKVKGELSNMSTGVIKCISSKRERISQIQAKEAKARAKRQLLEQQKREAAIQAQMEYLRRQEEERARELARLQEEARRSPSPPPCTIS